jgi:hypothetical protein
VNPRPLGRQVTSAQVGVGTVLQAEHIGHTADEQTVHRQGDGKHRASRGHPLSCYF